MTVLQDNPSVAVQIVCPLCRHAGLFERLSSPLDSIYRLCDNCRLIFIEERFLPDPDSERERYLEHENGLEYPGYVNFLYRAITPALKYLKRDMQGLDYGCGPVPTLGPLLEREGMACQNYDPFFFPRIPQGSFDFIFVTEAVEHFFQPGEEFNRIRNLLKPDGLLTIMTELWNDRDQFSDWYYAKDYTHVSFYSMQTIDAICDLFGFRPLHLDRSRVSVLSKI